MACHSPFTVSVVQVLQFSINVTVTAPTIDSFHLSVVYGPLDSRCMEPFLAELVSARALLPGPWLLIGDFNLISSTAEKNNANINKRSLASFRRFISDQELKDLHLFGWRFTWSNERASPTLVRLDRALTSSEWDALFPDCMLQALSSDSSIHCPLLLTSSVSSRCRRRFHFESFWTKQSGFLEVAQKGWTLRPAELPLLPSSALVSCSGARQGPCRAGAVK